MRHVISILMENEAGALSRVAGLFSARGYNIESLTVAPTDDATLSRLTLVTVGSDEIVEQIIKQLHKLVDVVKVMDLNDYPHIEREMMLVKIDVQKHGACDVVKRISDIFRARIIDVGEKSYTVEVTGSRGKLDGFLQALHEVRVVEVVRSGSMGIARGAVALNV
ncbi:MAG: acetolactate synthase small subunit [Thiofilum sp.]|uniref:acetolactate synthase small subunit n=1 Tax=Thiofilum sp. TaxID=2212733 RepID=UPI0025E529A7|nr:acetolactate synthase small subunit [Thiofilum sp.]MBK8453328.1 acetolactate synthase small subunit [Thiofilum sp.]